MGTPEMGVGGVSPGPGSHSYSKTAPTLKPTKVPASSLVSAPLHPAPWELQSRLAGHWGSPSSR